MASPFPGMDPYLENPELWSAVHSRLIVAIADDLVDHLDQRFRVEIEKRTYLSSDDGSLLVGIPDVAVATGRTAEPARSTTTLALPVQPQTANPACAYSSACRGTRADATYSALAEPSL